MKIFSIVAALVVALVGFNTYAASDTDGKKVHYVAFHVSQNDPKVMNMTLNNVQNVRRYYDSIGEKVVIEVVAYGPGLNMLREDKSPVKERIAAMSLEISDLKFAACGNTRNKMAKKEGMEIPLVSEAVQVTSGVVQLISLQEQGYSYVRP